MKLNWLDPASIPTGPVGIVCSYTNDRIAFEGVFRPTKTGKGYAAEGFAFLLCGLAVVSSFRAQVEVNHLRGVGHIVEFNLLVEGITKHFKHITPAFLEEHGLKGEHLRVLAAEVRRGDCFVESPIFTAPTAESTAEGE